MIPALFGLGAALAGALLALTPFPPPDESAPPDPPPAQEAQEAQIWDLEYGAYLAEGCHACHAEAAGGSASGVPLLDGRPTEELRAALEAYASGARLHDQMGAVARSLSAEERGHVAAWFAAQAAPR